MKLRWINRSERRPWSVQLRKMKPNLLCKLNRCSSQFKRKWEYCSLNLNPNPTKWLLSGNFWTNYSFYSWKHKYKLSGFHARKRRLKNTCHQFSATKICEVLTKLSAELRDRDDVKRLSSMCTNQLDHHRDHRTMILSKLPNFFCAFCVRDGKVHAWFLQFLLSDSENTKLL